MRHEYRVTKYDPRFRDSSGRYTRREWTSISDVGKRFGGRTLRMAEYLAVESNYLSTLEAMLSEAGVSKLELRDLEVRKPPGHWREGKMLTLVQAIEFARLALREQIWGKLAAPRRAFVHFGYDYYMYVGVSRRTPKALQMALESGMFIERFPSPYRAPSGGAPSSRTRSRPTRATSKNWE